MKTEMLRRSIRANMAETEVRLANRPPDAAIPREDQVDVLGRGIEMLSEKLKARDSDIAEYKRTISEQTDIIEDTLRYSRRTTWLAAALFCVAFWLAAALIWRAL